MHLININLMNTVSIIFKSALSRIKFKISSSVYQEAVSPEPLHASVRLEKVK